MIMRRTIELLTVLAITPLLTFMLINPVHGQEASFAGVWRGQTPMNGRQVYVTITFLNNGSYSQELVDSLGVRVMESGAYQVSGHMLHLTVDKWEPSNLSQPPGSNFQYSFPQTGTMVLHDVNSGGTIALTRGG